MFAAYILCTQHSTHFPFLFLIYTVFVVVFHGKVRIKCNGLGFMELNSYFRRQEVHKVEKPYNIVGERLCDVSGDTVFGVHETSFEPTVRDLFADVITSSAFLCGCDCSS